MSTDEFRLEISGTNSDGWFFTLLHFFELNANNCEPTDIEGVSERLFRLILLGHVAVSAVDACGPDFFARLLKGDYDIGAVHSLGQLFEQVPKFVPKRRNNVATGFLGFLHGVILACWA
ncbi:MAG: hypothetical protein ABJB69_04625 [Spartobacteria bacterium]